MLTAPWCFAPKVPAAVAPQPPKPPAAGLARPAPKKPDFSSPGRPSVAERVEELPCDTALAALAIRKVSDNVYCGPRPDAPMMAHLKTLGVKTIVNLEDYHTYWGWFGWQTRDLAKRAGIEMIRHPISPIFRVGKSRVEQIVDMLGNARRGPFYVHCLFGKERTNLVVALHRRLNQLIPEKAVISAMHRDGFRSFLVPVLAAQAGDLLHNPQLARSTTLRDGEATASPPRLERVSAPATVACLAAPKE